MSACRIQPETSFPNTGIRSVSMSLSKPVRGSQVAQVHSRPVGGRESVPGIERHEALYRQQGPRMKFPRTVRSISNTRGVLWPGTRAYSCFPKGNPANAITFISVALNVCHCVQAPDYLLIGWSLLYLHRFALLHALAISTHAREW